MKRKTTVLILALGALPAAAQNQLWIKQFGTSAHETISSCEPDGSGGVFVCGSTDGSFGGPNAGGIDAWLARFDATGSMLWIRQLGTDNWDDAKGLALDGTGGIYVAGKTQGNLFPPSVGMADAWLVHYDALGNQVWARQFGTSENDLATCAAADLSGGVFVAGSTAGDLGGPVTGSYDPFVAHYDSAGNQQWVKKSVKASTDYAFAAAPDGIGGVYSCGDIGSGDVNAWVARRDGAGNEVWRIELWTWFVGETALAAAPDGSNGVYVAGITQGDLGGPNLGSNDAFLAHCTGSGSIAWVRQLGTTGDDGLQATAPDGTGGVYVGGWTPGDLGGPQAGVFDAWFARFDNSGNKLWINQLGTTGLDGVADLVADGQGGLYVSGHTYGSLGGQHAGGADIWLARYDGSCGVDSVHCIASATSIPGCQSAIGATGSPSLVSPSGFTITSGNVPGGNLGICFLGNSGSASIPFGTLGGMICVQPPVYRTSAKPSGGAQGSCNGTYTFTLQDLINASPIVVVGASINAEIWARDPANSDGFLLSNGLSFTVCP